MLVTYYISRTLEVIRMFLQIPRRLTRTQWKEAVAEAKGRHMPNELDLPYEYRAPRLLLRIWRKKCKS
jgi:hypothetical protein